MTLKRQMQILWAKGDCRVWVTPLQQVRHRLERLPASKGCWHELQTGYSKIQVLKQRQQVEGEKWSQHDAVPQGAAINYGTKIKI